MIGFYGVVHGAIRKDSASFLKFPFLLIIITFTTTTTITVKMLKNFFRKSQKKKWTLEIEALLLFKPDNLKIIYDK